MSSVPILVMLQHYIGAMGGLGHVVNDTANLFALESLVAFLDASPDDPCCLVQRIAPIPESRRAALPPPAP